MTEPIVYLFAHVFARPAKEEQLAGSLHTARPPTTTLLQGDAASMREAGASLTELDLTGNLVAHWSFVPRLCSALPSLRVRRA